MILRALIAVLLAAPPAAAGDSPDAARQALGEAGGSGSVHALLPRAFRMAREWSPGAALYSILGRTPRNDERYEPEEWGFIFGDPETRDGTFEVVFHNGVIFKRRGIRESVKMVEFFKDGSFVSRRSALIEWEGLDYKECRPVAPKFVDTLELMKEVHREKLRAAELDQYRVAMLNARDNHCDGLGFLSQFITEKPIPKDLHSKTLWIVSGAEETLFFSGKNGKLLYRRPRKRDAGKKKKKKKRRPRPRLR